VVTSASGSFGKRLVVELSEKKEYDLIRALDVIPPKFNMENVENINGDIGDLFGLKRHFDGAETVFHVASVVSLREEEHRAQFIRKVNVVGSEEADLYKFSRSRN